jgi:cysteine desulfurase
MAAAVDETVRERTATVERVGRLRDQLADGITAALDGVHESAVVDGDRSNKLPNICHLAFDDIDSEALLFLLEKHDVMASAASSCSSGAQDPSHVLAAMGMPRRLAAGSLRLSLGYASTSDDVVAGLDAVVAAVTRLRSHRATFPSAGSGSTGGSLDG